MFSHLKGLAIHKDAFLDGLLMGLAKGKSWGLPIIQLECPQDVESSFPHSE
jgi:hypothetical protein